jgi:hypothetical protein
MKIIMFQYNRTASAIIQENGLSGRAYAQSPLHLSNQSLKNNSTDRLLREECIPRQHAEQQPFIIQGVWQ